VIFRSYPNRERITKNANKKCTILQACRATSAAPTFFPPLILGDQKFIDGGLKNNNPIYNIVREARDIWPNLVDQAILVSLGTGNAPSTAFVGNVKNLAEQLSKIATETEDTARQFLNDGVGSSMAQKGRYFRFNVPNLAQVGLEEWKEKGLITSLTETYVDDPDTKQKTSRCISRLAEATAKGAF
jgi:predicted acylesterase/phospholipase RssA